jgi:hypothetical protein
MAALFWNSHRRNIVEGNPLSGVKVVIAGKLQQLGFTDIRRNDLEVAGNKNGCVLSIGHFQIAPNQFWEIVMCGGPDGPTTQRTRDEAVAMLANLGFF